MHEEHRTRKVDEEKANRPIIFQYSDYDYRIILGTVLSRGSIAWDWHVIVSDWDDAKRMIDLWHENEQYPAFRIKLEYRGDDY